MAHFEWRRFRAEHREESLGILTAVPLSCDTNPRPVSFTFSLLVLKATLNLPFSSCYQSSCGWNQQKYRLGSTVILITFFNEVLEISKTVKNLNLPRIRIFPNLAKKLILPKKWQNIYLLILEPLVAHIRSSSGTPRGPAQSFGRWVQMKRRFGKYGSP